MYFEAVAGKPPRDTLLFALDRFDQSDIGEPPHAVDLGCGEGRDTAELLRRGWRVTAIDGHPEAIARLLARDDIPSDARSRVTTLLAPFENLVIPRCDLLNASFALPFCPPGYFDTLWDSIVAAIAPGGRFAGQLFGDRDTWATLPDRTHHTREQVDQLLSSFSVEMLEEADQPGNDAHGNAKHWHVYHIVARKRGNELETHHG